MLTERKLKKVWESWIYQERASSGLEIKIFRLKNEVHIFHGEKCAAVGVHYRWNQSILHTWHHKIKIFIILFIYFFYRTYYVSDIWIKAKITTKSMTCIAQETILCSLMSLKYDKPSINFHHYKVLGSFIQNIWKKKQVNQNKAQTELWYRLNCLLWMDFSLPEISVGCVHSCISDRYNSAFLWLLLRKKITLRASIHLNSA